MSAPELTRHQAVWLRQLVERGDAGVEVRKGMPCMLEHLNALIGLGLAELLADPPDPYPDGEVCMFVVVTDAGAAVAAGLQL